ncbi:hypothetical protein Pelo_19789 [Pelomyxa schiedti]|nr:hypothetical protein Pelo_19789 [Pelomyxa schiedti]
MIAPEVDSGKNCEQNSFALLMTRPMKNPFCEDASSVAGGTEGDVMGVVFPDDVAAPPVDPESVEVGETVLPSPDRTGEHLELLKSILDEFDPVVGESCHELS